MIEVNKRLYMDEQTLEKAEGFEKLKQDIQSLYGTLLKD
jgi:N-formylglutamate amidohydrolase